MKKVLICDADYGTVEAVSSYLAGEEYEIYHACEEEKALALLCSEGIHLLILDPAFGTGKADGSAVVARVREQSALPVIILSARDSEADKIRAFQAGADDYITKPFSTPELAARVRSQLRRYMQLRSAVRERGHIYQVGGLLIDEETRKVMVEGREVRLTPIEYQILTLLAKHHGRVYSIPEIYETIWHMQAVGADNTIAVHIRHIREKIECNPRQPQYLKLVWGSGYKVG